MYKACKEQQKRSKSPSLVDPENVKLQGKVDSGQVVPDMTPASKKKMASSVSSPTKAGKKKSSQSSPDEHKSLDDKWAQIFA